MSTSQTALRIAACLIVAGARLAAGQGRAAPSSEPTSTRNADRVAQMLRRRVDIIDASTLAQETSMLAGQRTRGQTVLTSSDDQTTYLLVHRTTSSEPEVHARWDDIVLMRSGTAVIELGDSLVGSTLRAAGERMGGRFHASQRIIARPGDIIRIPAAVPHAFVVEPSHPVDYLVIKQRRQSLPIRWYVGQGQGPHAP